MPQAAGHKSRCRHLATKVAISHAPFQRIPTATSDPEHPLQQAALTILDQGKQLLSLVPGPAYVQPSALVFNASIGGHYRHCLDHFGSFLTGLARGVIDYDQRKRDPAIERDRDAARSLTRNLRDRLELIGQPSGCTSNQPTGLPDRW
jgi:hypothetical protein